MIFVSRVIKQGAKVIIYFFAAISVIIMRVLRPIVLIRYGNLLSFRIGHFAGNTELYLCERDAGINRPQKYVLDFFYLVNPISNHQLMIMWKRTLKILPSWFLIRVQFINQRIPGSAAHEVGFNSNMDRDVHNLLDKCPIHLNFTYDEEKKGLEYLKTLCVPKGAKFVCLFVRDSAYLNSYQPGHCWSSHDYRDANIQNYVLVSEKLVELGYYVIRMGAAVKEPIKTTSLNIIDYAVSGCRNDFMDIYLGAKCEFCITTSSGWDAIPRLFRRPMVFTNVVPLGYISTFSSNFLILSKRHFNTTNNRELTLSEIFVDNLGFGLQTSDYQWKEIKLIENTPDEILDVTMEMVNRLKGTWKTQEGDEELQQKFWELFPTEAVSPYNGAPLHGEITGHFSTAFLRNNKTWLQ